MRVLLRGLEEACGLSYRNANEMAEYSGRWSAAFARNSCSQLEAVAHWTKVATKAALWRYRQMPTATPD